MAATDVSFVFGGLARPLPQLPPALISREKIESDSIPARRTKIWEFHTNMHCSIVGTCLSANELRQVLKKLGLAPPDSTDHALHAAAVTIAGRHDPAGKLLNKALDQRHRLAVNRFAKAQDEDAVRALWRDAVVQGDIPGAYWAALTHPAATQSVVREAFNEVHMLSHLVGAANRADIRRLRQLEAEQAELDAKLARQQATMRDAIVSRDATIRELRQALATQIAAAPESGRAEPDERIAILQGLVGDLEWRLSSQTRRRADAEARLAALQDEYRQSRTALTLTARENEALRMELHALEAATIGSEGEAEAPGAEQPEIRLDGLTLLYVGGRPRQSVRLRDASERLGASFLHHDGGIEHGSNLLHAMAKRADLVLFPVDCVSHEAVIAIKAVCKQTAKRFVPLRTASISSMLAGLSHAVGGVARTNLADAAD